LYPENVTLGLSIPLKILHFLFKPAIYVLNGAANLTLRVVGLQPQNENKEVHTSEELRFIIEESTRSGNVENEESELIENIFDFKNTPVKQIMIPRNQIIALSKDASINDI